MCRPRSRGLAGKSAHSRAQAAKRTMTKYQGKSSQVAAHGCQVQARIDALPLQHRRSAPQALTSRSSTAAMGSKPPHTHTTKTKTTLLSLRTCMKVTVRARVASERRWSTRTGVFCWSTSGVSVLTRAMSSARAAAEVHTSARYVLRFDSDAPLMASA